MSETAFSALRLLMQKVSMFGLIPLSAMLSLWGLPSPDPRLLCLPASGWPPGSRAARSPCSSHRAMRLDRPRTGSMY